MGICHEQRADRTRFIIDEDYKIKQEMIQSIKTFTERKREEERLLTQKQLPEVIPQETKPKPQPSKPVSNTEQIISKNRMTLTEEYEPVKQLGVGGYGQVFLVKHKKMNLLRAMKVIPAKSKTGEKTNEEIELLKQLDHPNIVKLFEYFCDDDKYYLITEYCKGGDLFDLIKKKKNYLNKVPHI